MSLDVSSDIITGWRGDHTHDNELIENNANVILSQYDIMFSIIKYRSPYLPEQLTRDIDLLLVSKKQH